MEQQHQHQQQYGSSAPYFTRRDEERLDELEVLIINNAAGEDPDIKRERETLRQRRERFVAESLDRMAASAAASSRRVFHAIDASSSAASSSLLISTSSVTSSLLLSSSSSSSLCNTTIAWILLSIASLVLLVGSSMPEDNVEASVSSGNGNNQLQGGQRRVAVETPVSILIRHTSFFIGIVGVAVLALQIHYSSSGSGSGGGFRGSAAWGGPITASRNNNNISGSGSGSSSNISTSNSSPGLISAMKVIEVGSAILLAMTLVHSVILHVNVTQQSQQVSLSLLARAIQREQQIGASRIEKHVLLLFVACDLILLLCSRRLLLVAAAATASAPTNDNNFVAD